jgi:D-arabinose 1-dehydrogenase-like Zn-dependent alcohol dehydrogenase
MASMRAIQVKEQGGPFELVEREVPEPGRGEALVRVQACGICHSDSFAKTGGFPGISWPHVPGHEVAGLVAALGKDVNGWEVGQRVGVGWFGGSCGYCRRGDLMNCAHMEIPGITIDGGCADYVLVKAGAMAAMPDELSAEEAARCCARASPPTTPCVTAVRMQGISWRSWAWGDWGIWAC